MNFELIDNGFQIIILGLSTIAALFLALRYKSRSLLILALAYACFCMGTAYYILYLVIMGKVPQVFYVAEISWLAAWIFYLSVQILRMERIGYRFSWFAGSAAVSFGAWYAKCSSISKYGRSDGWLHRSADTSVSGFRFYTGLYLL